MPSVKRSQAANKISFYMYCTSNPLLFLMVSYIGWWLEDALLSKQTLA